MRSIYSYRLVALLSASSLMSTPALSYAATWESPGESCLPIPGKMKKSYDPATGKALSPLPSCHCPPKEFCKTGNFTNRDDLNKHPLSPGDRVNTTWGIVLPLPVDIYETCCVDAEPCPRSEVTYVDENGRDMGGFAHRNSRTVTVQSYHYYVNANGTHYGTGTGTKNPSKLESMIRDSSLDNDKETGKYKIVCEHERPPESHGGSSGGSGGGGGYKDTDGDGYTDTPCNSCGGNMPGQGDTNGSKTGSGRVLCTYFALERHWLTRRDYIGNMIYGQRNFSQASLNGYQWWAIPVVRHLREHKGSLREKIIFKILVEGWVYETAHRAGYRDKGSLRGKIVLRTVKPLCTLIGQFVGKQNHETLWEHVNLA